MPEVVSRHRESARLETDLAPKQRKLKPREEPNT
jgi:hypothetical protein